MPLPLHPTHRKEEKMLAHLGKIVLYVFPCIYKLILSKVNPLTKYGCRSTMHNNDLKRKLSNEEIAILQDLQTTGYSAFTLQLCYKFFIHFEWFEPPTQRWGKEPTVDDIALADDIERIRHISNKIHLLDVHSISQDVYNQYIEKVKQVCERIELSFDEPGHFSSKVEHDENITTKEVHDLIESLKEYKEIADNPFPSNIFIQGRSRYARFGFVVVEILPKLIREVIGNSIQPKVLLNQINAARRNDPVRLDRIISHDERVCLNTLKKGSYKDLDFTTIYKLIRSFALVDKPTQGWGKQPMMEDNEIADDIERLRIRRNYIVHNISTNISQTTFDEYFSDFIEISKRVDTYLGKTSVTGFETEVHHYKNCSIDYDLEQKYTQALQEIEDIKYRFTEGRTNFYYGKSFEKFIENVKAELAKYEKRKIIIVIEEDEDTIEKTRLLNALKTEIDTDRIALERVETGSLTLFIDVLGIVIISESFHNDFGNFIEKILNVLYPDQGAKQIDVVMMESDDCCELNFLTDDENIDTCTSETPVDKTSIRFEVDVNSELFQSDDLLHGELANFIRKASDTNGTGQKSEVSAILCSNVNVLTEADNVKLAKVKTEFTTDEDKLKETATSVDEQQIKTLSTYDEFEWSTNKDFITCKHCKKQSPCDRCHLKRKRIEFLLDENKRKTQTITDMEIELLKAEPESEDSNDQDFATSTKEKEFHQHGEPPYKKQRITGHGDDLQTKQSSDSEVEYINWLKINIEMYEEKVTSLEQSLNTSRRTKARINSRHRKMKQTSPELPIKDHLELVRAQQKCKRQKADFAAMTKQLQCYKIALQSQGQSKEIGDLSEKNPDTTDADVSDSIMCQICETDPRPASYWCKECLQTMCRECDTLHRAQPTSSTHTIITILLYKFHIKDINISDITSLCEGELIIGDHHGQQLITCDIRGQNQIFIPLPYSPRRLVVLDNGYVAVTTYMDKKVLIVDVKHKTVTQQIDLNENTLGIMYRNNNLYVGCSDKSLVVLDMSGEVIRTLPLSFTAYGICSDTEGRMYCTDYNTVYCIDTDGNTVFTVTNPDMSYPSGITTDNEGQLTVVCKNSNNVHRMSPDGEKCNVIITDIPYSCIAPFICCDQKSNSIAIGCGDNIYIYTI